MDAAPLGSDSSGFKPHPASCDLASHYPLCPISPTLVSWLPWRGGWGLRGAACCKHLLCHRGACGSVGSRGCPPTSARHQAPLGAPVGGGGQSVWISPVPRWLHQQMFISPFRPQEARNACPQGHTDTLRGGPSPSPGSHQSLQRGSVPGD